MKPFVRHVLDLRWQQVSRRHNVNLWILAHSTSFGIGAKNCRQCCQTWIEVKGGRIVMLGTFFAFGKGASKIGDDPPMVAETSPLSQAQPPDCEETTLPGINGRLSATVEWCVVVELWLWLWQRDKSWM